MGIAIKQRTEVTAGKFVLMLRQEGVSIPLDADVKVRLRKVDGEQLIEIEWTAPERVERDG